MGVAASEASKQLAHSVSLAITLTVLTNIAQMVYWKSRSRRGTRWQRRGPTILALAAVPLATLDLVRHLSS